MPNPLAFLPGAVSQPQQKIIWGQVSSNQPAPTSFSEPLYVTRPAWNPDYNWAVTDWPACHGSTLPAQGAECLLLIDTAQNLRCVWWDGGYVNDLSDVADRALARENLGFAWGSAPITWSSSAVASVGITHGLGHTPVWFSLTLELSGQVAYVQATSVTSTTIAVNGQAAASGSYSGTVFWAAF